MGLFDLHEILCFNIVFILGKQKVVDYLLKLLELEWVDLSNLEYLWVIALIYILTSNINNDFMSIYIFKNCNDT